MRIAIGIILNSKNQILITQRALDSHYGGYWEFPGGKIEEREREEQALVRELKEELNLDVKEPVFWCKHQDEHDFYIYGVKEYTGQLKLQAQQTSYRWVNLREVEQFKFPPSNQAMFKIIRKRIKVS